ncbi:hypothetical protein M2444_000591 [Paenibacillus sp. PastF-3]|nr:hypothetical protein [Paenibacillus sp. PastF-3]
MNRIVSALTDGARAVLNHEQRQIMQDLGEREKT